MRSLPRMFALAIGCLSLLPIAAQQLKPAVEIRTAGGQTTFHMGERISIILSLTGPDNKKYGIDTASYDRSGRLTIDSFDATPATGWSDPLTQYFSRGFMMGGLRGSEQLSSKPVTFTADLNEQIRFDQPGTYTINATSHRVGTIHGENSFPREPFLSILSNAIQIHIIPATPEWQAEKLRSILAKPIQRRIVEDSMRSASPPLPTCGSSTRLPPSKPSQPTFAMTLATTVMVRCGQPPSGSLACPTLSAMWLSTLCRANSKALTSPSAAFSSAL